MSRNLNRNLYADQCHLENQSILNSRYLLKYERDRHGRPVGVVIAFKDGEGEVKIGWSRCHTKLESFDKHIGINKAIKRSQPLKQLAEAFVEVPHPTKQHFNEMVDRAERYFHA